MTNDEILLNKRIYFNPDADYLNYLCTWSIEIRKVLGEDGKVPYGTSESDYERLNTLTKELDEIFPDPIFTRRQFDREKRLSQLLDS